VQTALLLDTGPSMGFGTPPKRLQAVRAALREVAHGAWIPNPELRWVPPEALAAALLPAGPLDLVRGASHLRRSTATEVVLIGDLYDPASVLEAMRRLRGRRRRFVEILSDAERGLREPTPAERPMVALFETLRPHRQRAFAALAREGVELAAPMIQAA